MFGIDFRFFLEQGKWRHLLKKPLLIPGIYLLKILTRLTFLKKLFINEGKQEVLTLIAFFSPNLVGTETYLDNLASILSKSGI